MVVFDWDDANRDHLGRHGILPVESEEALTLDPVLMENVQDHADGPRSIGLGRTNAGRLLTVIYIDLGNDKVRVITAWDMTNAEQRIYFEEL